MNSTETVKDTPASSAFKPYWLVFFTVVFLVLTAGAFAYWALHSQYFARFAVDYFISQTRIAGLRIEIDTINGSIASGLLVEKARIRQAGKQLDVKVDYAQLDFTVADLLRSATISVEARINTIDAAGLFFPDWPDSVPAFSSFSCFAGLPANIQIKSLRIDRLNLRPHPLMLVEFGETDIFAASESGDQQLKLVFNCSYRGRKIGQGEFDGRLAIGQKKIEGNLDLELARQRLSCEISLGERHRKTELSGFIATATIDMTALSRWLSPMWQDDFPFGFDGTMNFTGSWLYNNDVGFVGNIAGNLQKVRMVAMGLFIPIFELNADWRFFDGNLVLSDTGSLFVYFPAVLSGKVDSIFSGRRRWDITFSSSAIDFARLVSELPWGARFGLALPELAGVAEFFLSLKSTRPEVNAYIKTDSLQAGKGNDSRQINGRIAYALPASGAGECTLDFEVLSAFRLPPFFRRFHGVSNIAADGPFVFSYKARGPDLGYFTYEGEVLHKDEILMRTSGNWEEGFGHARALITHQNKVRTFVADNIQTLDLILAN